MDFNKSNVIQCKTKAKVKETNIQQIDAMSKLFPYSHELWMKFSRAFFPFEKKKQKFIKPT